MDDASGFGEAFQTNVDNQMSICSQAKLSKSANVSKEVILTLDHGPNFLDSIDARSLVFVVRWLELGYPGFLLLHTNPEAETKADLAAQS